jgi:hypothetical protein
MGNRLCDNSISSEHSKYFNCHWYVDLFFSSSFKGEDNLKINVGAAKIKDVELYQSNNDSITELYSRFNQHCTRIKKISRTVDQYKVEPNKFDSTENNV